MAIIDSVINSLLGELTLDPAGMHCPSWDDAFVSSYYYRHFPPGPWARTGPRPLLRHGRDRILVDPFTRPSFDKVMKSVTDVSVVSPDIPFQPIKRPAD